MIFSHEKSWFCERSGSNQNENLLQRKIFILMEGNKVFIDEGGSAIFIVADGIWIHEESLFLQEAVIENHLRKRKMRMISN